MKVLLVSENRLTTLVAPFPLGLAFVAGSLRDSGHETAVLDLMFLDNWQKKLHDVLNEFRPDVTGLSIRNIDNQDALNPVFYLRDHLEIIKILRSRSSAPVVLGGAGFNIYPEGCLRYLGADMGIYGEGEEAFATLLETMEKGVQPEKLPGVVWRMDDQIIVNSPSYIAEPERWNPPSYEDFDVSAYHNDTAGELPGCVTVQTKRGCHMKCIYCTTPFLEGRRSRIRDLKKVVKEMAALSNDSDIKRFYVTDNIFNFPLSSAKDFCREIIAQGLAIQWSAIINPAFGDEELFELMSRAGCTFIALGNESGADLILKNLRKGFTLKNIKFMAGLARSHGIRYGCFLLLGGPGETMETVKQSIEFLEELEPDLVTVKAGIRIYPGTELEEIARSHGQLAHGQDVLLPAFYISPEIKERVWAYLERTCGKHRNWKL